VKTHLTTKNTVRRDCSKFSNIVEAKATEFCPQGVLEVEASPRGPHPCRAVTLAAMDCWNSRERKVLARNKINSICQLAKFQI